MLLLLAACASAGPRSSDTPQLANVADSIVAPAVRRAAVVDRTAGHIAYRIDSTLAAYGIAPLRETRAGPGEREVRVTTDGGMAYYSAFVIRIVERGGEVRGELYEWWPRLPGKVYAGGPLQREKRAPELDGCLDPRISRDRWVCRIDRVLPVDWRRVLSRLDSLQLDELPPQRTHAFATDLGHVVIEVARGERYNGVYYYGPHTGRDSAEVRAAAAGRVLAAVVGGGMLTAPDSMLKLRPVAAGDFSIPGGALLLVRNEHTWRDLWRRFPSAARHAAGRGTPPRVDFSREAVMMVGEGAAKEDCVWPPDYVRRVEVRRDTAYVVLGARRPKQWPPPCDPDPAPVQTLAFPVPPGVPVVLVYTTGRYWQPEWPATAEPSW